MNSFSMAVDQANQQAQPVVRGMTAKIPASKLDNFLKALVTELGGEWKAEASSTGWVDAETANTPDLGKAWDAARRLQAQGFDQAEPLLLMKSPSPENPDPNARLDLWGQGYSWSDTQAIAAQSLDTDWSIKKMKVDEAWKKFASPAKAGEGVIIAHPDTGYSTHPQIIKRIITPGLNFVEFDGDAKDRYDDGLLKNPGHGTATSSVIVSAAGDSGDKADVIGVAPGAKVWPIRVSTSVVHFDFLNVARAIENAVNEAHVISMSLGGPKSSPRLRDAVKHALDEGIIIVSAAGNMVPAVMFPAAIPGVVAMAASNPIDGPWRWSGFGDEVTATAPGEMIWNARAAAGTKKLADADDDGQASTNRYSVDRGHGTSFATAAVAGIAALWLSHHGRDNIIKALGGDKSLLPFAFHMLLRSTSDSKHEFIRDGKGGFGAGIVDALKLLEAAIPKAAEVKKYKAEVLKEKNRGLFNISLNEVFNLFRMPNRPDRSFGSVGDTNESSDVNQAALAEILNSLLGGNAEGSPFLDEVTTLLQSVPALRQRMQWAFNRAADPKRRDRSLSVLRADFARQPISAGLLSLLESSLSTATANPPPTSPAPTPIASGAPDPQIRRLRAYAFDPSLALQVENRTINEVTITIPWEDLQPGPVGEYLEIVDVDPATDCVYDPVDLNHPYLLAQDGLSPSEGNPQFHQQMVYAVAMKTIKSFERALGRPAFWTPLRPWRDEVDRLSVPPGFPSDGDSYVQRLRIYPHALRERNAYYSPEKRALLFGYFAADESNPGEVYPGGIVFTCLSHDVIAHETTHALLDGMHAYFNEPTNPDVYAFHEAFSDIIALFQHFSYPGVLRSQVARGRGSLSGENLLVQLAQQFGKATGKGHALRDAIGGVRKMRTEIVESGPTGQERKREVKSYVWDRYRPDATALEDMDLAGEAHARGSILVAAVFDAFLAIYDERVADLVRIATGGTGKLPDGNLQPDLVERMCMEARKSAEHVLNMCIRALDYTPPVDITFGEYLRAIITIDRELVPDDSHGYRTAFIQAFRAWGIYPRDVRVLSEESLTWHKPVGMKLINPKYGIFSASEYRASGSPLEMLRKTLLEWKPNGPRKSIFEMGRYASRLLHAHIEQLLRQDPSDPGCPLPDDLKPLCAQLRDALFTAEEREKTFIQRPPASTLKKGDPKPPPLPRIRVTNLRPARRIGPNGEFLTELVLEVIREDTEFSKETPFAGGITFVVRMEDWEIRYAIFKRYSSESRRARQRAYIGNASHSFGAAEYMCTEYKGDPNDRVIHLEAMRAASCQCRHGVPPHRINEPFAMLHREPPLPPQEDEIVEVKK